MAKFVWKPIQGSLVTEVSKAPCYKVPSQGWWSCSKWLYPDYSKFKINRFGPKSTDHENHYLEFFSRCKLFSRIKGLIFLRCSSIWVTCGKFYFDKRTTAQSLNLQGSFFFSFCQCIWAYLESQEMLNEIPGEFSF